MIIERLADNYKVEKKETYIKLRNVFYYGGLFLSLIFLIIPIYAGIKYGWFFFFMFLISFGFAYGTLNFALKAKAILNEVMDIN